MFEIPEAKRVRRDELFGNSGSDSEDEVRDETAAAAAQAKLQERLSSLITFEVAAADQDEVVMAEAPAAAEEVFEFRLFATPGGGTAASSRVVLAPKEEPTAAGESAGAGGFVVPRRPQSYYIAGLPTPEEQMRFEAVAVTGEQVLAAAGQRCWGLEVPWRVTRIVVSSSSAGLPGTAAGAAVVKKSKSRGVGSKGDGGGDAAKNSKKKRPGKRKRIAIRIKTKKVKEQDRENQTKEEHLKAKKKRLNRERQLKRRQKEREKKQGTQPDAAGEGSVEGGNETTPAPTSAMQD